MSRQSNCDLRWNKFRIRHDAVCEDEKLSHDGCERDF